MVVRGGLASTHGTASASQSLQTLAGGAIVVAALYFARDVLIRSRSHCCYISPCARGSSAPPVGSGLSAPPAQQVIGRTVLVHRVSAGDGVPATFAVTRKRPDGTIAVVIGDVGPGSLSGPLMAAAMSAAAERIADEGVTAGDLLNAVSRIVQCPDHGLAVSATAAILFPQAARIEVTAAGYCPPILLRHQRPGGWSWRSSRRSSAQASGRIPMAKTFTLDPGDRVLFYTSGAAEVTGTSDTSLGVDGFARLAAEQRQEDPEALLASLDAALGRRTVGRSEGWSLLSVDLAPDAGRASAGERADTAPVWQRVR